MRYQLPTFVLLLASSGHALSLSRRALARFLVPVTSTSVLAFKANAILPPQGTNMKDGVKFKKISPIQFIAALGDPAVSSGAGAEQWGVWRKDPGPRGVELRGYDNLKRQGKAASGWLFNNKDWWLEEHGLIMENTDPLPAGKYVVTGDRGVTTVLDVKANGAWKLTEGTLADVTHGPCRAGRYTSTSEDACSPASVDARAFPVRSGGVMPQVAGCAKQDYAVLFILAVEDTA